MSAHRMITGLVIATAAIAIHSGVVEAQAGSVVGSVYDSIRGVPLTEAAIFLWDTPYRGVSDADGRYQIEGVPAGDYSILFFHQRLGEAGVSAGPRSLTVGAGDQVEMNLATPVHGHDRHVAVPHRGPPRGLWGRSGSGHRWRLESPRVRYEDGNT